MRNILPPQQYAQLMVLTMKLPTAVFLALLSLPPTVVRAAEEVCVEGFVMDQYCLDLGRLLDTGHPTLEQPDQHSVHCLVDVQACVDSDFNMLRDPTFSGGLYAVAYTVDAPGKELLVQLAREAGNPSGCSSCTSAGGTVERGFRAEVRGTVGGNGRLQVASARPSNDLAANEICAAKPVAPNAPTAAPADPANNVPTAAPAVPAAPSWLASLLALCFSGHSTVVVKGRSGVQRMDSLQIGDEVVVQSSGTRSATSSNEKYYYSKVYSFGHWDPNRTTEYLQFWTNSSETSGMEITANHMLYSMSGSPGEASKEKASLRPAGEVAVGDFVLTRHGVLAQVRDIRRVLRRGAFAPFTESGTIAVNGIAASNYISLPLQQQQQQQFQPPSFGRQHWIQHAAYAPYRIYCSWLGGCETETYDEISGLSRAVTVWLAALRWLERQNGYLQYLFLYLVAVPGCFLVLLLEKSISSPSHILAAAVAFIAWRNKCASVQKTPSRIPKTKQTQKR